jgi:hypothetical protein
VGARRGKRHLEGDVSAGDAVLDLTDAEAGALLAGDLHPVLVDLVGTVGGDDRADDGEDREDREDD